MFMVRSSFSSAALAPLLLLVAGCGTSSPEVTGTVTYRDGQPVQGGTITLTNKDAQVIVFTEIEQDGSFALKTNSSTEDLPAGTYTATVVGTAEYNSPSPVAANFSDPTGSPLVCEVTESGENSFALVVDRSAAE